MSLAFPCSFCSKPCGGFATPFLLPLPPVEPKVDNLFSARTVSTLFNSFASLDFCSLVFSLVELSSIINSISSSVSKFLISTSISYPERNPTFLVTLALAFPLFSAYARFGTSCGLDPPVEVACLLFASLLSTSFKALASLHFCSSIFEYR